MRFIMKTIVLRPTPRLIHAFQQNLSGCARAQLLLSRRLRSPAWAIWVIGPAQIELIDLLGRAQSCFSRLLLQQYAHCKSLLAPVST